MLKKLIPFLCIVVLILSFTIIPSSAASYGTDMIDTFEYYPNNKILEIEWRPAPNTEAVKLTLDDTTSAPNRGKGANKGNYRSMKVEIDRTVEGWDSFRNTTENPYALKNLIECNGNGTFNFWAKADKNGAELYASLDIKDDPFYTTVKLTTEWKEYKIDLRKLKPTLHERKDLDFIEITRKGLWPSGLQEAYLVGFKFGVESPDQCTIWLDSISISGDGISEVHEFTSADGYKNETLYDRDGSKPANFVSSSSGTSSSTDKNSSTTSSSNKNSSTTSSSNKNSSSTSNKNDNSSYIDSSENDSTSDTIDNSDVQDIGNEEVSSGNDNITSAEGNDEAQESTDVLSSQEIKSKLRNIRITIIVLTVLIVLADGAFAFYYFYWRKRKMSK